MRRNPSSNPPSSTDLILGAGVGIGRVGRACLMATRAFLEGAAHWTKNELALWLAGPYRLATCHAGRHVPSQPPPAPGQSEGPPVDPGSLRELLWETRHQALAKFRASLPPSNNVGFTVAAMHHGWVVRARDDHGRRGWVPVDRPRMRLADRLTSLLAAHRLTCPDDLERGFLILVEDVDAEDVVTQTRRVGLGAAP